MREFENAINTPMLNIYLGYTPKRLYLVKIHQIPLAYLTKNVLLAFTILRNSVRSRELPNLQLKLKNQNVLQIGSGTVFGNTK